MTVPERVLSRLGRPPRDAGKPGGRERRPLRPRRRAGHACACLGKEHGVCRQCTAEDAGFVTRRHSGGGTFKGMAHSRTSLRNGPIGHGEAPSLSRRATPLFVRDGTPSEGRTLRHGRRKGGW